MHANVITASATDETFGGTRFPNCFGSIRPAKIVPITRIAIPSGRPSLKVSHKAEFTFPKRHNSLFEILGIFILTS